jgi:Ca-activated chloride channel family protein
VGYRAPAPATGSAVPSPGPQARRFEVGVPDAGRGIDAATADYKFAAAVVGYGLLLRDSPFKGDLTWDKVLALAEEGQGPDREGYRAEFLDLVRRARDLSKAAGRGTGQPSGSVTPRP